LLEDLDTDVACKSTSSEVLQGYLPFPQARSAGLLALERFGRDLFYRIGHDYRQTVDDVRDTYRFQDDVTDYAVSGDCPSQAPGEDRVASRSARCKVQLTSCAQDCGG
jgi:hypothetical protein